MRLQKFGHSCVLVEDDDGRVLIDPGSYSQGFETLSSLTGILVTHQHPDHVDVDRLPALLEANPQAVLHTDEGTAEQLADKGIEARVVHEGDRLDLGIDVRVAGRQHAAIHADVPRVPNVGYLLAGRVFHPGDSLTDPGNPVEILCLPTMAPWLKAAEAVDYLRQVRPGVFVPIHEAMLKNPQMFYGLFERLAPDGAKLRVLDDGSAVEL